MNHQIELIGEICDDKVSRFIGQLLEISDSMVAAKRCGDTVDILISSPGGDEYLGWACYDAIRNLPDLVVTAYAYGGVYSIAMLPFLAADFRYASINASFMIHSGSLLFDGEASQTDIIRSGRRCESAGLRYLSAIEERTGSTGSQLKELYEDETEFAVDKALELGFIHGVIGKNRGLIHVAPNS